MAYIDTMKDICGTTLPANAIQSYEELAKWVNSNQESIDFTNLVFANPSTFFDTGSEPDALPSPDIKTWCHLVVSQNSTTYLAIRLTRLPEDHVPKELMIYIVQEGNPRYVLGALQDLGSLSLCGYNGAGCLFRTFEDAGVIS